jgi:hypothetical protein
MMALAGFVGESVLFAIVPLLLPAVIVRLFGRVTQ